MEIIFFPTDQIEIPDIELTLDKWRSTQDGREMTNEVYPINVDQLFTLLFTNSKFYRDFHANRKTFGNFFFIYCYCDFKCQIGLLIFFFFHFDEFRISV